MEGDDETANVLNSLDDSGIPVLQQIRIVLGIQADGNLTLAHEITRRRLGTPIATILIRLNTSIQNNPYNPPKNFPRVSHIHGLPVS